MGTASQKWLKIALVGSVCVNLLVVGVVAGAFLRNPDSGGTPPAPPSLRQLTQSLPDARRDDLRQVLRSRLDGQRQSPRERVLAGRALQQALLSDPFDRDAMDRVLSEQRVRINAVFDLSQSALLDTLESMTLAEREAYAQSLRERRPGAGRDGRDRREDGERPPREQR
ncbi:putative membrane protein [Rubricella aquisinus]|uniref:Putative membrane protein n=1 Tax=Rubricella aquisinus TaxID=2028108 RepID=A0A840X0X7_9RHOB|nr:periplasmic heavy metal sensor [Rubricella aquisinus]MBB5515545.1 putative membrane protein [Rubricella aquisinus]